MAEPRPAPAGPVPLRPLGFGDVLDGAFKIVRAEWRTLALVTGLVVGPLQLVSNYFQRDALGQGLTDLVAGLDPEAGLPMSDQAFAAAVIGTFALFLLFYPPLIGALTRIAASSVLGTPASTAEALGTGARRWLPLLAAWFTTLFVVFLPLAAAGAVTAVGLAADAVPLVAIGGFGMLLGLPVGALIFSFLLAAPSVIVVERAGPIAGLRRSAALIGRRVFPVFGVVLVASMLVGVINVVLSTIPSLLGMLAGETIGWIIVSAGSILANLVTMPFFAAVLVLLYFDGRIRREGLDLELAAARLQPPQPLGG